MLRTLTRTRPPFLGFALSTSTTALVAIGCTQQTTLMADMIPRSLKAVNLQEPLSRRKFGRLANKPAYENVAYTERMFLARQLFYPYFQDFQLTPCAISPAVSYWPWL